MVRNTFINYDSEIGFSPRIFVIRFLPPGTNYYYYFFFFEGLLLGLILLYTFFMVKSEALASHVLCLQ